MSKPQVTRSSSAKTQNTTITCSKENSGAPKDAGLPRSFGAPEKTSGSPRGSPSQPSLLATLAGCLGFSPAQAGSGFAALTRLRLAPVSCCGSCLPAAALFFGHPASLALAALASVREAPLRFRLARGSPAPVNYLASRFSPFLRPQNGHSKNG